MLNFAGFFQNFKVMLKNEVESGKWKVESLKAWLVRGRNEMEWTDEIESGKWKAEKLVLPCIFGLTIIVKQTLALLGSNKSLSP
ncbi:MAG: hypothetical protein EA362_10295 [Saprospirales bacterium]|nr:MAG: hypothetical protein EA362_10295 [Saprospirales bacterium]